MKIGININGVLRDFFGKIEVTHDRYFPSDTEEEMIKIGDYNLEEWVIFPNEESKQNELTFDPDFNDDIVEVKNEEEEVEDIPLENVNQTVTLEEFMYERCTLDIFGHADEPVPNSINHLNNLILNRKDKNPEDEFIIISRELGLSIPATLFFLSKTKSQCQNIKFITDNRQHWKWVKVMVTDHPDVITSKPKDAIVVKVRKPFNEDLEADFTIDSIKELDNTLLNSISSRLVKVQKSKVVRFTS